jgi:argininosuccinate synthase
VGGKHGIGRLDLVESRFVGMKSRGVYETPAGTILLKAHLDLEGITLDREVMLLKECMAPKIAQIIYNGFWFSPEMEFLMAAVNQSQKNVTGKVNITLYKGNVIVTGRSSPYSLYNPQIASMDVIGGYDQTDAKGFIKLQALRLMVPHG